MKLGKWVRSTALLLASACAFQTVHALVFTEIQYHPSVLSDPNESLEYIEIRNNTSHPVDLSGYHFVSGVRFAFPENFLLAGWDHIVVCADAEAVRRQYGLENVLGNYEGRLDNDGEQLQLSNRAGAIVAELRYGDRDPWPRAADGTGYTLTAKQSLLDVGNPRNWTHSGQLGGTPGIENFPPPQERREFIFPSTGPEALWTYQPGWNNDQQLIEEFSEPPSAWFSEDFDDSAWLEGASPIGSGEDEIATQLPFFDRTYQSFATRKRFHVTQEQYDRAEGFVMEVGLDDGAVVYLNGAEIARISMDGEPGTPVPAESFSRATTELNRTFDLPLPKNLVRVGDNLLAVQVHNRSIRSLDIGVAIDFQLRFREFFAGPPETSLRINEVVTRSPAGRSVELHNSNATTLDLSGYELAETPLRDAVFIVPDGTTVESNGFVVFTEAELRLPMIGETFSLFLYEPGGNVVDAVAVEAPELADDAILSHTRWPDGSPDWRISTKATPGAPNEVPLEDGLVINEIHYAPRDLGPDGKPLPQGEATEFFEIYNRSDRTIPLGGLGVDGGYNYEFEATRSLAPGEYLVIAPNPEAVIAAYGLTPKDVVGPPPGASADQQNDFGRLRNSGEHIRLVDRLGNPIDEVYYRDGGEWSELADGGGSSLELVDANQDNSVGMAWEASDESGQSEWTEFAYEREHPANIGPGLYESEIHLFLLSSGECLIDDLSVESTPPEGVEDVPPSEHVSGGDFEDGTQPWRLWGNHIQSFQTSADAQSGTGSLHLVATGPGNNKANRLEVDAIGQIVPGTVKVRFWAKWLRGSNALHVSGHNNGFGATVFLPVPIASGTPARENRATRQLREVTGQSNQGPVLSAPMHSPAVPNISDEIQFRLCASDSDGVSSVAVLYQRALEENPRRAVLLDTGPLEAGRVLDTSPPR